MIRNKAGVIFLSVALLSSASFAENVHVKRVDGGSGGGSDSSGSTTSSGPSPAVSNGGRVHVERSNGGGGRGGWGARSTSGVRGGGRVRVVPRSDVGIPRQHTAVVRNTTVIRNIQQQRRVEVVPNRYYWHSSAGVRYCHYFRGGIDWYGFYDGPRFYWTRYHADRWWWFDPGYHRWLYWSDGYWWYPGPGGVLYVYENDAYYPSDEAPEPVTAPERAEPPEKSEDAGAAAGSWTSPDGQRMVQSTGPRAEAFLYDTSQRPARYLAYLGESVGKVRFNGGSEGKPVQILVDFKDGTFALFSADGKKVEGAAAAQGGTDALPATPPPPPPGQ